MLAIEITQPGGAEVLQSCQRPMPEAQAGEVLIQVSAAGINRLDILQRIGRYPPPAGASDIPGLEVAGTVVDGDLSGTALKLGDRVCALVPGGGYAEYAVAANTLCLPIPGALSNVEAASLPEAFFTTWSNIFDRARLRSDETLLVQGGSSGVGVAAIQIARALGHRVFATAGSDQKCQACEKLGAERAINYREQDFNPIIKELTHGRGVDVILDMVGASYLARELDCLAEDGRIVLIAVIGGSKTEVDLGLMLRRRLTIGGSTLRGRSLAFKTEIARKLLEQVWPLLESDLVQPVVDKIFPLEQAAQAHRYMESGAHIGKIVLTNL